MAITFHNSFVNAAPDDVADYWEITGLNLPAGLIVVATAVCHTQSQGNVAVYVNGVAATQRSVQSTIGPSDQISNLAIWSYVNPTANPAGTIRVAHPNGGFGGNVQRAAMAYWSLTDANAVPPDWAAGSQTNPVNMTIDVPVGVVIAVAYDAFGAAASGVTWSNATEQFDTAVESRRWSGAHQVYAAAQTNLVVSANIAGAGTLPQGCAVSFTMTTVPPITGTLGVTEAADTAAMAGTVTGYVGRVTATEAADVPGFAGVVTGYRQSVQVYVGGAAVGVRQENSTALAPVDQEFDITAARQWTPADFRDGNFAVLLGSHAPDSPFEGHWDATSVRITYVMPPLRTGILDATEAEDVAAFVGEGPPVEGTLAATEGDDVAAFVGELVTEGTLIGVEGVDVAAFAGAVSTAGTLAAVEDPDVAVFVGEGLAISGIVAATEAPDVAAITGIVRTSGVLVATEAADTATIVGGIVGTGTLVATEAPDAAAFTGGVVVGGALAVTEAADVASFVGAGTAVNGILAATEAADAAIFAGKITTSGALAASEASDVAAFVGDVVAIRGTLAVVEAADVAAFTGGTVGTGTLAATEASDVALFTAASVVTGTLDATEAPDAALAVGGVAWVAKLAAVEQPDGAAFTGTVRLAGILVATEAPDVAAFTGGVVVDGTLNATEEPDVANFFETSISGFFAALESPDNAIILATTGDYGIDIIGDQDPNTIHGGCEGVPSIIGNACTPTIKGSV